MRFPVGSPRLRTVSDMTETRKWTVGAAVVAVVILAAGWFLLISPKRAEVSDLQAQTADQQATNSQTQTQLAVLKQQNKDLPEKQAELAALRTKIPLTSQLPTYIREMQDIGDAAGVDLQAMTPAAAVNIGASGETAEQSLTPGAIAAVNVEMIVTGGYFEITRFVNELESTSRYTLISGFTITDETTDPNAAEGDLQATVQARIFMAPEAPADGAAATEQTVPGTTPAPAPTPTSEPAS